MTTSRTSCYTVARPYVGEILTAAAGEWAVAVDRARATFSPGPESPQVRRARHLWAEQEGRGMTHGK
jgi:hypothetical protein